MAIHAQFSAVLRQFAGGKRRTSSSGSDDDVRVVFVNSTTPEPVVPIAVTSVHSLVLSRPWFFLADQLCKHCRTRLIRSSTLRSPCEPGIDPSTSLQWAAARSAGFAWLSCRGFLSNTIRSRSRSMTFAARLRRLRLLLPQGGLQSTFLEAEPPSDIQ